MMSPRHPSTLLRLCIRLGMLGLVLGLSACDDDPHRPTVDPPLLDDDVANYTYAVVNSYPHDRLAFTQGLFYHEGVFYEGTGLVGQSRLRRVEIETGQVLQQISLGPGYFGEGIALVDDRIIQLTWTTRIAFVHDRESFAPLDDLEYDTEGWGLTYDGTRMIMSDGTAQLFFRDPVTFAELGRVDVFDGNGPVALLNELEYIEGRIFANVWTTDFIVVIDPETGEVTQRIDLVGILPPADRDATTNVLNGIAWDEAGRRLFVTGKRWSRLYEIELVPVSEENS